jgi:hypothetical protein
MNGEPRAPAVARALDLAGEFWNPPEAIGHVRQVEAALVPLPFRELLDHCSHMTVAMERHHGGAVQLRVENVNEASGVRRYAREILLLGPAGDVVQYGIVRIDLSAVAAHTAAAIRVGKVPLGRLLIEAGVLRDVRDVLLVEITCGPRLTELFRHRAAASAAAPSTFGRVAAIDLNGRPAVELLEIAAPAAR